MYSHVTAVFYWFFFLMLDWFVFTMLWNLDILILKNMVDDRYDKLFFGFGFLTRFLPDSDTFYSWMAFDTEPELNCPPAETAEKKPPVEAEEEKAAPVVDVPVMEQIEPEDLKMPVEPKMLLPLDLSLTKLEAQTKMSMYRLHCKSRQFRLKEGAQQAQMNPPQACH